MGKEMRDCEWSVSLKAKRVFTDFLEEKRTQEKLKKKRTADLSVFFCAKPEMLCRVISTWMSKEFPHLLKYWRTKKKGNILDPTAFFYGLAFELWRRGKGCPGRFNWPVGFLCKLVRNESNSREALWLVLSSAYPYTCLDCSQIDLKKQTDEGDVSNYQTNGEFDLVDFEAIHHEEYYSCCPEPYPDITYVIKMRRRPLFYVFNLILPCLLINGIGKKL